MTRSDPRRVLAAQLTGTAARCAQAHAITVGEAMAEMNATLAEAGIKPGTDAATEALTMAAELYAVDDPAEPRWYYPGPSRCWSPLGRTRTRPANGVGPDHAGQALPGEHGTRPPRGQVAGAAEQAG